MNAGSVVRRGYRARFLLAALVVLFGSIPGPVAQAQTEANFSARAAGRASGVQIIFSRPGTAPIEPVLDLVFGLVGGSYDDLTGERESLASSFYPGSAATRPQGLIGLVGFPIFGNFFPSDHPVSQGYASLPELLPTYPLLVTASYPGEAGKRVDFFGEAFGLAPSLLPVEVSGARQEASADQSLVSASVQLGGVTVGNPTSFLSPLDPVVVELRKAAKPFVGDLPDTSGALVGLEGVDSGYNTLSTGTEVKADAYTLLSRMQILGGLLEFQRVRVFATHRADNAGVKTLERGSEVGLARVLGIQVAFDDQGMRLADSRIPTGAAGTIRELLDQVLAQAGVKVRALTAEGKDGEAKAEGLVVTFQAQEPSVPGVAPIGNLTTVTLKFGELDSTLETFPGAPTVAGGDLSGGGVGSEFPAPTPDGSESFGSSGEQASADGDPFAGGDSSSTGDPISAGESAGDPGGFGTGPIADTSGTSPGQASSSSTPSATPGTSPSGLAAPAPAGQRQGATLAGDRTGSSVTVQGQLAAASPAVVRGFTDLGQRLASLGALALGLCLVGLRRR